MEEAKCEGTALEVSLLAAVLHCAERQKPSPNQRLCSCQQVVVERLADCRVVAELSELVVELVVDEIDGKEVGMAGWQVVVGYIELSQTLKMEFLIDEEVVAAAEMLSR